MRSVAVSISMDKNETVFTSMDENETVFTSIDESVTVPQMSEKCNCFYLTEFEM